MVNERGLNVHHTTVFRWVQRYAPELDKRCPLGSQSPAEEPVFYAGKPGVENWHRKPSRSAVSPTLPEAN